MRRHTLCHLISLKKYILGLLIVCSTFACQTPEVNNNIYGLWYEPIEGGGVELRPNGVAVWYGQEGSFDVEVSRVDTLACGLSQMGCYYGDVTITVGDEVHQTRYYQTAMNANGDAWYMTFDAPVSTPSGYQVNTLRMQRVDQLTGPQTREGFTRMDEGLEDYYTGDGEFFSVSDRWVRRHLHQESRSQAIYLWNEEGERWELGGPEPHDRPSARFVMGESLIYVTDGHYSVDGGVTFDRTRTLAELPSDGEEIKTVILGQEVISLTRVENEEGDISNEIWALNLESAQPRWTRRHRVIDGNFLTYLLVAPTADALIIGWLNDQGPLRSVDGGRSWTQINTEDIPCEDNFLVNEHPAGCWCATQEDRYVYDARQDHWMTLEQAGWTNSAVGIPESSLAADYPLFVIENGLLTLVDWSGLRTPAVQIASDLDGWRLQVYSDRLLYPHHALWTAPFSW